MLRNLDEEKGFGFITSDQLRAQGVSLALDTFFGRLSLKVKTVTSTSTTWGESSLKGVKLRTLRRSEDLKMH